MICNFIHSTVDSEIKCSTHIKKMWLHQLSPVSHYVTSPACLLRSINLFLYIFFGVETTLAHTERLLLALHSGITSNVFSRTIEMLGIKFGSSHASQEPYWQYYFFDSPKCYIAYYNKTNEIIDKHIQ